ncbi:hypothetical protein A1C_04525 [Rickettsia akari str. Hartford]|uniref:Uncharacterized protein n=1 Tax=Rickettsia akari (strain Hartford) TaxID=293614 RepID=A8GP50_RICAH|nr:hypothetical protein A1C_04525 [Rickettsia akari str. Hartford]
MSNRNSLEVQEYAQCSSLNNTNLIASQGGLILTVANLLFKDSNINNNNQNIQRGNIYLMRIILPSLKIRMQVAVYVNVLEL